MTEIWFIAAGVLVLAELLVTTFFMLPFAIGAFFAGTVYLLLIVRTYSSVHSWYLALLVCTFL